ncbi:MAG: aminotransferase class I/II-fold pyridoxal phosphate-dependent enzyme [Microbacteriaceae bacterium]|nr:aminotransferase class I/II-fold pyridoxal phosphate-dependent enzyme [Microbacteriaceae bacterium]
MTELRIPTLDELRDRRSEKWRAHPDDVLPMFIAEMDFALAPAVREALAEAVAAGDTGYIHGPDRSVFAAFADFAADRWGWRPDPARMERSADVGVVIVETLRRVIEPGDGVIIMPPVYPPFWPNTEEAGGRVVEVPFVATDDGRGHRMDLAGVERALASGEARAVLLCNPHNPLGVVHTRAELAELAEIVERHGGAVVSDEIHAPLVHSGVGFTPYLDVSDAARAHGIAAVSGSKAFNLAGLKWAAFVAASERTDAVLKSLPTSVGYRGGLFGELANRAAFEDARGWLDEVRAAVERNFALLRRLVDELLPGCAVHPAAAGYLAWLDLRALEWGDDPAAVALERARVALSNGPAFGAEGRGFARMNLACAPELVEEAVRRIAAAR